MVNLNVETIVPLLLIGKILILIFIILYLVFCLVAFVQIRSLDKLVSVNAGNASKSVQSLFLFYLFLVVSLLLAALVIL